MILNDRSCGNSNPQNFRNNFVGFTHFGFFQTLPGEAGVTSINIHLTGCIQVRLQLRGEIWGPTTPTHPKCPPPRKMTPPSNIKIHPPLLSNLQLGSLYELNVCEEILPLLVLKFKVQTRPCKERCQGNLLSRWSPWFCGFSAMQMSWHNSRAMKAGYIHYLPFWMITWQQSILDVSVCDLIYAL